MPSLLYVKYLGLVLWSCTKLVCNFHYPQDELHFELDFTFHFGILFLFKHHFGGGGGGTLVFEVGYHPRKKIHVIRVVFQDQAMYSRTSLTRLEVQKRTNLEKKCVFLVKVTNFGKDMMDKLRKTHAKMCI